MVDAIEREEDVSAFRQVRSPPDLVQILADLRGSDAPLSPAQELACEGEQKTEIEQRIDDQAPPPLAPRPLIVKVEGSSPSQSVMVLMEV